MTITRRTFGKAVGGLFAAALADSTLLLDSQRPTTFDLRHFCDEEPRGLFDLRYPFAQDGMTYATDDRICVRTKRILSSQLSEDARLPQVNKLAWLHGDKRLRWRRWRTREIAGDCPHTCPDCRGKGRWGSGVVPCSACSGYEYEYCGCTIGYVGGVLCGRCNGEGEVRRQYVIGDECAAPRYAELVSQLPDVEYVTYPMEHRGGVVANVIAFRFNGGEGLLGTLRRQ